MASLAIPTSYKIPGIPLYQQIDASGCGAASLQMVFAHYGPFIDQMEIYDAARTHGTTLPDLARAAQFSNLSTTVGDRFEKGETTGYQERSLGYAGFFYASTAPWLDQLKAIVAQGYPVIVLVHWLPGTTKTDLAFHYRVVIGYDDAKGVLMMLDPWSRQFKNDMNYQGSSSGFAGGKAWDTNFGSFNMTYADFLTTWNASTTIWGVPGLAYGGVLVTPWQVQLTTTPASVSPGATATISATITYPVLAPFGSGPFPTFPASGVQATLGVGNGAVVVGGPTAALGSLSAGQSVSVAWTVHAGATAGSVPVLVTASGLVSGSLGPWGDWPAYSYTDQIGGTAMGSLSIGG
ncbi:MAG TPA: C39 family peptidase [Thermoplasmata archaeon]|nr:C39 family peptidase [Thermoplasmata archaeon]